MEKKLLYIISNYSPTEGCPYVRDVLPAWFLEKQFGYKTKTILMPQIAEHGFGQVSNIIPKKDLDWADIVMFCRHYPMDINPVLSYLKGKKPIVWETDDDLKSLLEMNDPHVIEQTEIHHLIDSMRVLIANTDLIIVSVPFLAGVIQKHYKPRAPIEVIYNHIDFNFYQPRNPHRDLRIGWQGGGTHARDIINTECLDAVVKLQKKYDFTFYIQGITTSSLTSYVDGWQSAIKSGLLDRATIHPEIYGIIDLWENLQRLKKWCHVPFYTVSLYPSILKEMSLDVGVCPITHNDFNNSRSCNKYYEYAALGTVTLPSKEIPYTDELTYLAENTEEDWYNKLERLIKDKKFRKKLFEEQYDFVYRERNAEHYAEHWDAAFRKYL